MESRKDVVRVKQELNDTWPDASDDYNFDLVDSCEVKNFETFPFYELTANHVNEDMALQERLDEKIFVDFECKNVKLELMPLSTTKFKTEDQSYSPIVKIEKQINTSYLDEKSRMILMKKEDDCDNKCQLQEKYRFKYDESEKLKIFEKKIQTKLAHKGNLCRKTYTEETSLKTHINLIHESIPPYACKICYKTFRCQSNVVSHTLTVHDRIKPFKCDICHKSFGYKGDLAKHINTVHNRSKPFECEICRKSFGQKSDLKRHVNAVHDRSKPFECEICQKSFGRKEHLKAHIHTVHDRIKSFECDICQKLFEYQRTLYGHINAVHFRRKPFECEICHKSFGYKSDRDKHMNSVHKLSQFFECDIS